MKIRNKTTGEIATLTLDSDGETLIIMKDGEMIVYSVAFEDLVQDWEDVLEESKEYWYINFNLEYIKTTDDDTETDGYHKLIGNYFETKEEAEKAVEKLKAWKRLKDKGFEFCGWCEDIGFRFTKSGARQTEVQPDLDLLFGGEE